MLAVPLVREGVTIGMFSVARHAVDPFTPQQISRIGSFADQAVIAIENARLFEESQQRAAELEESNRQKEQLLGELHAVIDTIDYGFRRAAPSAQDHEIVRIGDEARAEALLKP